MDDAVDLAHLFALDLALIAPQRVVVALAGKPVKAASVTRLQALLQAGAVQKAATQSEIYAQLAAQGTATGSRGLFVVTLATPSFNDQGNDFLVSTDSLWRRIQRTGVAVSEVFNDVSQDKAPRRLGLLDACRERLDDTRAAGRPDPESAMRRAFASAIAEAAGQVALSGTTLGRYSYDDQKR